MVEGKREWLKNKRANIQPISYVCASNKELLNKIISNDALNDKSLQEKIHISAELFGDAAPLDFLNNKQFLNLNNIDILIEVQYLLQLGEGFGFPINKHNIDRTLIEFIKNIENNIIGRQNNTINSVRNNTVSILESFRMIFLGLVRMINYYLIGLRQQKNLLEIILKY